MNTDFWHERWNSDDIAFHQEDVNALLIKHFEALNITRNGRVFIPLCGKSHDIAWLLNEGFSVVGAELSELAIKALFSELGLVPTVTTRGKLLHFQANNIDMFVGDIFDLQQTQLGKIDAVYDRAALVALPEKMRPLYSAHILSITQQAPQLLITFDYNQALMQGPPFSISESEIAQHFAGAFNTKCVAKLGVVGGLKGKVSALECAWLLQR